MRIYLKVALFVLGIGLVIGGIAYPFANYSASGAYQVDQAQQWLWRARATNDLYDMEFYLNKTYQGLIPFTGNPCWIFPKPDTDFDQIKMNIQECAASAHAVRLNTTVGSFGYQQAVSNLQETLSEIADHLSSASDWLQHTAAFWILEVSFWVFAIIFIAVGAFAETTYRRHDSRY
jgi:hypothetical protein